MRSLLDELRQKNLVWRGGESPPPARVQGTGYVELDHCLQGGFPRTGVVEIDAPTGIGELRLLAPWLGAAERSGRQLVFVGAPGLVSAEWLAQNGIAPGRVLSIRPRTGVEALWAAEQCLKSRVCEAVLLWHRKPTVAQVRRLQLAANSGHCLQFLFTRRRADGLSLPVPLSLQLRPHVDGVAVAVRKRRGGRPQEPFAVSMAGRWPELASRPVADNVLPFPAVARAG